jgi:predicted Rossmann fold nucleotide-binding protein DprA/Smf involved in DNA uptake
MELSENAKVVLLLCCPFQAENEEEEKSQTLSPTEWHQLSKLLSQNHKKPEDLLSIKRTELQDLLSTSKLKEKVEKIHSLLLRGIKLSFHLEDLAKHGIQVVTIEDDTYPERLRLRLKNQAPPFLFYAGERELLGQPGIAVLGSRHIDKTVSGIAKKMGEICGQRGLVLYSGGAKGVDEKSMEAALNGMDGYSVGILAHSLIDEMRRTEYRKAIARKRLCLATPFLTNKGFQIWKAMARNKIIYALADFAVVIRSDSGKGGTWAGAMENLRYRWVPLYVVQYEEQTPQGNQELIKKGGLPLPYPFDAQSIENLMKTVSSETSKTPSSPPKSSKENNPSTQTMAEQLRLI